MVDVAASSNPDLSVGLLSQHGSGGSSPLQVDVPPTNEVADNLFLSSVGVSRMTEIDAGTAFFKEMQPNEVVDCDIYRGGRPPSPIPEVSAADEASVASSSSSSSLNVGRRFVTLASVVEAAITRWARAHSSASSSSSSSSSSSVSSTTRTHTTRRRKGRRYSSTASVYNAEHARALLARKKAQEEFRLVAREFTLLLPSDSVPGQASPSQKAKQQANERRVIKTTSMLLILAQLDSALKKSAKSRRTQERSVPSDTVSSVPMSATKGKGKKAVVGTVPRVSAKTVKERMSQRSWWLDVANPSWDDLRSIGRLLHLHPLTLEDILHRDPREKLELFPGLGYYFIVFRALEGERSRERFRRFKIQGSEGEVSLPSSSADEGVVGAVNVYIVVFAEGICSFHFEDISEHTDKLRNKVLQMEHTFDMTSDWIAHGLIDSIVDSFFPILTSIEKEVKEVDSLVLGATSRSSEIEPPKEEDTPNEKAEENSSASSSTENHPLELHASMDEKGGYTKETTSRRPLSVDIPALRATLLRHIRDAVMRIVQKRSIKKSSAKEEPTPSTTRILLKMAAIRRIVTYLVRLLGTKGEVVTQIRKRLILASTESHNAGLGLDAPSDAEVAIYMGDIQDHIVSLQQSLNHYERMLSHSHPAYLSQLRVSQSLAKGDTDKSILLLTVVSITVLSIQLPLGLFSMNLGQIPNNKGSVNHPFAVFFSILGTGVVIAICVVSLVRHWYLQARKKYSRVI